jgi:hypothetical protein
VAIIKRVDDHRPSAAPGAKRDITQPSFSYAPTDALADVIVRAWSDNNLYSVLMQRDSAGGPTTTAVTAATTAINGAGFDLERAVIISEQEHDDDYKMRADNEVVFVLPNKDRAKSTPQHSLLATAKLLMACTPNGI